MEEREEKGGEKGGEGVKFPGFSSGKLLNQLAVQVLLLGIMDFYLQMKKLGKWEKERNIITEYWREFQLVKSIIYMRSCRQIFVLNTMQKICRTELGKAHT